MTYQLDTRDGYARTIIRVGRAMGITPRGIVIGLATGLVESQIRVYANGKVPESLRLPYDSVGSDGLSVGIFQQQVRRGDGGRWWWADCETCMNPETSARLFFERLFRLDYNSGDAGKHAQTVQQSAYPDRYAERMPEAQRLYDRLSASADASTPTGGSAVPDYGITQKRYGFNPDTPDNATGNSYGPRSRNDFVVIHTEEGNSTALGLADYCNGHGVSYNLIVDGTNTVENVPVNEIPWAAVDANGLGVHICFAGSRAAWDRAKWHSEGAALDRAAKATAAACKQYGVPVAKIRSGGGWDSGVRGLAAHADFGARGGGHTDPGPNFPWDDFTRRVNGFMASTPAPGGGSPVPALTTDQKLDELLAQLGTGHENWKPLGLDELGRPLTLRDAIRIIGAEVAEQGRLVRAIAAKLDAA